MSDIEKVKKLREATGAGFKDCNIAMKESNGDIEEAITNLRKSSALKAEKKASTSFLQRKLQIGYNRAARIIDMMEAKGEVSKANHVGKREILK